MLRKMFPHGDEIINLALTFLVVFASDKFGQYLFYHFNTSPAVLLPTTGIILAIVWIKGYRYILPIFIALILTSYTSFGNIYYLFFLTTAFAKSAGCLTGVYLLRKSEFDESFSTLKSMMKFLLICVLAAMVAPTITTLAQIFFNSAHLPFYFVWSRAWAGYLFSLLILFPFIISWFQNKIITKFSSSSRFTEIIFLGSGIILSVYQLFWRHVHDETQFIFFTIFFVSFFWACLRFSPRVLHSCVVFTIIFSITGVFISPDFNSLISEQLLRMELFFLIIVPIFYTFSSLVQESNSVLRNLALSKNKIEQESISKSEFIAVLAHELRNPLAPLKTTLEILEMEDLSSDVKKLIKSAHLQVHAMRRLLDDLLDTTRMVQGKFQLQIVRANLCTMLEHSIDYTKDMFKERSHIIIMDKICDPSVWLNVDPVRFEQIIVNILNNAAKYTDQGGEIHIDFKVENNFVSIKIKDNGVGIHPDNLSQIFDSFWQVGRAVPRSGGGIGIGLSLTKRIVEMHGGTITAESAGLGKGTTFIVRLPVANQMLIMEPEKTLSKLIVPLMNILVVDDNHAAADSMAKLLTLKGHTARVAYSGQGAIDNMQEIDQQIPDIVFLDIGLPDIDGYEVAAQLRTEGYKGLLVALSGYSQKEDITKAYSKGFNHYLTKPISIDRVEEYFINIHETQPGLFL